MIAQAELPSWRSMATMDGEASLARIPSDWPNRDASRIVHSGARAWHVQEFGQGPAVLLLHGTGASTHSWRSFVAALAKSMHVLAVDLPGHGYTEAVAGETLSLASMSRALGELLTDMAFCPAFVIGHSAGAASTASSSRSARSVSMPRCNLTAVPFSRFLRPCPVPLLHRHGSSTESWLVPEIPVLLRACSRAPDRKSTLPAQRSTSACSCVASMFAASFP